MKTPDEFFIPDNEVKLPDELDYSRVDEYIRSAEAFSRSSYQSVYVIDYFKQKFLYVSPNPKFLCGLTLCVVSASAHSTSGHIEMHHVGTPDYFAFNPVTRRWDNRT